MNEKDVQKDARNDIWFRMWRDNDIPFHGSEVNPPLVKYFDALSLAKGSRVFVPLCGKTLDIGWFLSQGYRVVAAELVEVAVEQLFQELGVQPERSDLGEVRRYSATNLDVFVGDIFSVSSEMLGSVDAIYDKTALGALPETTRERYAAHLIKLTRSAPQLLITHEFDQRLLEGEGPPFSVSNGEVERHYGGTYSLSRVESVEVFKGPEVIRPVRENVWVLDLAR